MEYKIETIEQKHKSSKGYTEKLKNKKKIVHKKMPNTHKNIYELSKINLLFKLSFIILIILLHMLVILPPVSLAISLEDVSTKTCQPQNSSKGKNSKLNFEILESNNRCFYCVCKKGREGDWEYVCRNRR